MKVIEHPKVYKEGVRVLLRVTRNKDVPGGGDRSSKKMVSQSPEEFDEILQEMIAGAKEGERIYSTLDPRDVKKAIRIFKTRQLEADYYSEEDHKSFYLDVKNRWISSLMAPQARAGNKFLIDIDDPNDYEKAIAELAFNGTPPEYTYTTKNGMHIITNPFNPKTVSFPVQKNAMMLVAY